MFSLRNNGIHWHLVLSCARHNLFSFVHISFVCLLGTEMTCVNSVLQIRHKRDNFGIFSYFSTERCYDPSLVPSQ